MAGSAARPGGSAGPAEPSKRAGTLTGEHDPGPPGLAQHQVDAVRAPARQDADQPAATGVDRVLRQQVTADQVGRIGSAIEGEVRRPRVAAESVVIRRAPLSMASGALWRSARGGAACVAGAGLAGEGGRVEVARRSAPAVRGAKSSNVRGSAVSWSFLRHG
jgi:hypothetical protein